MSFIQFPDPTPVFPFLNPEAWPVLKTPGFGASTTTAMSGRVVQLSRQVFPRWKFKLTYGDESWLREQTQNIIPDPRRAAQTELEQISGLFLACLGSYGEFYYSDPDDDSRLAAPVATADGTSTTYQLFYSWGTGPFTPSFYAPVTGIQTIDNIYFNGVAQPGANYSLDSTRTKVVFTAPPSVGVVITSDIHFYYRCRFLADMQEYEQWAKNLWEYKTCEFESVKP